MAALTKGVVRTAVQAAINDAGGDTWSTSDLDQLISLVEDTLFSVLLEHWPWLTSVLEATVGVSNTVALSVLVSQRLFAIQKVLDNDVSTEYKPALYGEAFASPYYYVLGGSIVSASPGFSTHNVRVTYSYLPARFTGLATDNTVLPDYPEGHEGALIYLAAAWALAKGDQESIEQVARIADFQVDALLKHISRRYPVPVQPNLTAVKQQIMGAVLAGNTQ